MIDFPTVPLMQKQRENAEAHEEGASTKFSISNVYEEQKAKEEK